MFCHWIKTLGLFFIESGKFRFLFGNHIRSCPKCRREWEIQQCLSHALKPDPGDLPLNEALHGRIMRSLDSVCPKPKPRPWLLRAPSLLGLSGALGLLLMILISSPDRSGGILPPPSGSNRLPPIQTDPIPIMNTTAAGMTLSLESEIGRLKEDLQRALEFLQAPLSQPFAGLPPNERL